MDDATDKVTEKIGVTPIFFHHMTLWGSCGSTLVARLIQRPTVYCQSMGARPNPGVWQWRKPVATMGQLCARGRGL
jgi:hypothetical protein